MLVLFVFFFFHPPSPRKVGGANVDGLDFVRRVTVQGCLCVVRGGSCGGGGECGWSFCMYDIFL